MCLQYNRARYYDPTTGRWTSQDPSSFAAGDANLYRYVQNNPTDVTDPSGRAGVALPLSSPQTTVSDASKPAGVSYVPGFGIYDPRSPGQVGDPTKGPTWNPFDIDTALFGSKSNSNGSYVAGAEVFGMMLGETTTTGAPYLEAGVGLFGVFTGVVVVQLAAVYLVSTWYHSQEITVTTVNRSSAQDNPEEWQRQVDELQDQIDELQQEIEDKLDPDWGYGKNRVDGSEQYLQQLLRQMAGLRQNPPPPPVEPPPPAGGEAPLPPPRGQ